MISELKITKSINKERTENITVVSLETSSEYECVEEEVTKIQCTSDQSTLVSPQQLYTALEPKTVLQENTYASTTPISCRSLNNLKEEVDEYDYVTPTQTPFYLQVIPSTGRSQSDLSPAAVPEEIYANEGLYENEHRNLLSSSSPLEGDSKRSQSDLPPVPAVVQGDCVYANEENLYDN